MNHRHVDPQVWVVMGLLTTPLAASPSGVVSVFIAMIFRRFVSRGVSPIHNVSCHENYTITCLNISHWYMLNLISIRFLLIVVFCDFLGSLFGYWIFFIFRISQKLFAEMYRIIYQNEALRIHQEPNWNHFTKYSFFKAKREKMKISVFWTGLNPHSIQQMSNYSVNSNQFFSSCISNESLNFELFDYLFSNFNQFLFYSPLGHKLDNFAFGMNISKQSTIF